MNTIDRICHMIAREFSPTYAMVVYMALAEFNPSTEHKLMYGSIAVNRLREMQDQLEPDDREDDDDENSKT